MEQTNKLGLIPLRNFGIVNKESQVYRSAQPIYSYEYEWLRKMLNIDCIINLRAESRHDNNLAPKHGIEVVNIDVEDHKAPTKEQADLFIKILHDKLDKRESVLIHCEHGHGRTSTFSVLAAIIMGQTLDQAIAQENNDFHYQFRHPQQIDFLNKYCEKLQPA
jgi:protein-tyrosine phosphatase